MVRAWWLVLPLVAASASAAPSLAVLPLRAEGLQLNEANRLNQSLRERSANFGYELQDQGLTTQLVEASQASGVKCDVNAVACGVELGNLAGVQFVLIGQTVKLPPLPGPRTEANPSGALVPTIGIKLALVDVKRSVEARHVLGRIASDPASQSVDVVAAVDALFGEVVLGELMLDVVPAGCALRLDGIALGAAPLPQLGGLLPGPHVIEASQCPSSGGAFLPWAQPFSVKAAEVALIQVRPRLDPASQPGNDGSVPVSPKRGRERVLVLDFRNDAARDDLVRAVRDTLVVQISRMKQFEVLSSDDLRRLADLDAEKQAVGCDDSSCLADIAGAVGASLVVFGNVAQLGQVTQINISVFDVSTTEMRGRESAEVTSLDDLPRSVRAAAGRIFDATAGPESSWGPLRSIGAGTAGVGVGVGLLSAMVALVADVVAADRTQPPAGKEDEALARRNAAHELLLPVAVGVAIGGAALGLVGGGIFVAGMLTEDL